MNELILGDSLDLLVDHRGKTPKKLGTDFAESGVPVVSAIMVNNGTLNLADARFIDAETYSKWMPTRLRKGDVLLTSEAPLGRVARVPDNQPLTLGQRIFGLRGKKGVLDSGFLFYALQTESAQADLVSRSTGTTVFGIRQSALRNFAIKAPSFTVQQTIAEILSTLDDKISVNGKSAVSAERASQALVGRVAAAPVPLAAVVKSPRSVLTPAEFGEANVWHYSLPAFDEGKLPTFDAAGDIKSAKFLLEGPSVLVSKLNPRFPRVWDIPYLLPGRSVTSTEFVVLTTDVCTSSVLRAVLVQTSFASDLEAKAAGTSGSHQRVRPDDLLATSVIDPRAIPKSVAEQVTSMGQLAVQLRRESAELARVRNFLLPQLMSGKLRVRDAEKQVEEVV